MAISAFVFRCRSTLKVTPFLTIIRGPRRFNENRTDEFEPDASRDLIFFIAILCSERNFTLLKAAIYREKLLRGCLLKRALI